MAQPAFSLVVHFLLDQESDDLFSHHCLLHGHIRHLLPPSTFYLICGGCTSPNSAPCLPHAFQQKCIEKDFFVALGCICTPCTPWLHVRLCSVSLRHETTGFGAACHLEKTTRPPSKMLATEQTATNTEMLEVMKGNTTRRRSSAKRERERENSAASIE